MAQKIYLRFVFMIIPFIILEQYVETNWKSCFYCLIPISLYGVMYLDNVYTHLTADGKTSLDYDIYGFCRFGVGILILFLIGFLAASFGLTILYRLINKRKRS